MDGVGTITVSAYLSGVNCCFINLQLKVLTFCGRLNECSFEHERCANNSLVNVLKSCSNCAVNDYLETAKAAPVIQLDKAEVFGLSTCALSPSSDLNYLADELLITLVESGNPNALSVAHGSDWLARNLVDSVKFACELLHKILVVA